MGERGTSRRPPVSFADLSESGLFVPGVGHEDFAGPRILDARRPFHARRGCAVAPSCTEVTSHRLDENRSISRLDTGGDSRDVADPCFDR